MNCEVSLQGLRCFLQDAHVRGRVVGACELSDFTLRCYSLGMEPEPNCPFLLCDLGAAEPGGDCEFSDQS